MKNAINGFQRDHRTALASGLLFAVVQLIMIGALVRDMYEAGAIL